MRLKYRCIHDIIYDLLKTLSGNEYVVKTRLCSSANLPLDRCNALLHVLESSGLITGIPKGNRVVYVLTDKGYAYIGLYEQLSHLLNLPRYRSSV